MKIGRNVAFQGIMMANAFPVDGPLFQAREMAKEIKKDGSKIVAAFWNKKQFCAITVRRR